MKKVFGLLLAVTLALFPSAARSAQKSLAAIRNLDWTAVTLDKIEKDLAEIIAENQLTDTNTLAAAFESSRSRIAVLKKAITVYATASEAIDKSAEFTKNISSLSDSLLDRIGELSAKRESYHKLLDESPSLTSTDLGKRFETAFHLLAGNLLRLPLFQLQEKPLAANEAEGAWNLQSLRCDQIIDGGWDEASYLARKEDLKNGIRDAGKSISLAPLEEAREKVRASKRAQQELAIEKQKQANQISYSNLQNQLLDQQAGKLNDATDQARQDFEQAQEKTQRAIDDN